MKDLPAWQRWGDGELAYSPRRGRHAVKVGLASTIALVFAVRYDWSHPSWVLMMILPAMMPVVGAAIEIVMARLAAVFLGGVFSLLVVATFIQEPVLLSVVIGLLIFGVVYGMTSSVDQVMFVNVGITIPVVVLVAYASHEQLEVVVFDRVVTLMLGAVIGLAVSITLWPVRALDELRNSVRQVFSTGRQILDARFESLLSGAAQRQERFAPEQGSAQRMTNHIHLLAQARAERRHGEDLSPRYLRSVVLVESLLAAARSFRLRRGVSIAECPAELREALAQARKVVEQTFTEHEQGLAGKGPWPPSTAALDDSIARLERVLDDLWGPSSEGGVVAVRFSSLIEGLREIRRDLGELVEEITVLRKVRAGEPIEESTPLDWPETQAGWRTLISINPDRVKIALKGAIAGLAGFYISQGLDIFTVLAMVFAILVGSAGTTGSARLAAFVIFVGVSLGIGLAWLGTIFLVPHMEAVPILARLPGLTILFALVFLFVGYLMGGRRLAPLALFMGIFFGVLFVLNGQPKVTTLDSHWSFFVSIWTAIVVGLAVNLLVWPMTAIGKLRHGLAGFFEGMADLERAAQAMDEDPDAFHAKYRRFAAQYYKSVEVQLKLAVAAEADKAITRAQVADALGFHQRLFDVSFALVRMRLERLTVIDQLFPDQQRVLTEATVAYLAGLAERVRSPGDRSALPDLESAMRDLVQKWKELRVQENALTSFSAEDVRTIRTSIERRVLLVESLQEFADWLAAQASPSSHAPALAIEQG
jgi:uncharacterized membrane protein YccC